MKPKDLDSGMLNERRQEKKEFGKKIGDHLRKTREGEKDEPGRSFKFSRILPYLCK